MLFLNTFAISLLLFIIRTTKSAALGAGGVWNENALKFKDFGIFSHNSRRSRNRCHRVQPIKSWGYQFPAKTIYVEAVIALQLGGRLTFMFHFDNDRDPRNLKLTTRYLLRSSSSPQQPWGMETDITKWKRTSYTRQYGWHQSINVVEMLAVSKHVVRQLKGHTKWLEIRVDIQGNATNEVTSCGHDIDDLMAENAHQLFVIAISVAE